MKRQNRPVPIQRSDPPRVSAPKITAEQITAWVNTVEYGQVVTVDLNDGSFVRLMEELGRRGYAPVSRPERERALKPFLVKVKKADHASE